ncbi:hypothetical protein J6590_005832 [Homalodisca vitripennis]|nr:hypothetical protein J6590_005832 [Homalodisca vitripennis]
MPRERDNIFIVMDRILKKISHHWIVITNETYHGDFGYWAYPFDVPAVVQYQPDVYIIPVYDNFVAQIMRIEKDNYFNPKGIFILVLLTDHCGVQTDKIKHAKIFNTMWSRNIFTVNLIILSKCDLKYTIVNARPFSTENTCRTVQNEGLRYFQEHEDNEYNKNFVQYEPESFNGCQFWAGTTPVRPYVIGKRIGGENEISYEFVGAYTSVLFALMTHPPLEKEIKNIQDLKDSGLKTGVNRIYLYFFEHIEIDRTTRSVLDNHFECPYMKLCLQQLISQVVSGSRGKHSALRQNSDDTFGSSWDHSYVSVKRS